MILLSGANDVLRVLASSATPTLHVVTSGVKTDGTTQSAVVQREAFASASVQTVLAAPGSGFATTIKSCSIRNTHASVAATVTVQAYDGATAFEIISVSLLAGYSLIYDEGQGWGLLDPLGRLVSSDFGNSVQAAVNALNLVVLASDVTNNNATANTAQDVTGLSFAVVGGETYRFRFNVLYTAAATTTGSAWMINGPASPTLLSYRYQVGLTTTSETVGQATAYDIPATSNASSPATTGNIAVVEGIIKPSASGTVILRFRSEITSSAIVAKAGSLLEWVRTL
jgi:hypothetical protein